MSQNTEFQYVDGLIMFGFFIAALLFVIFY